MKPRYNVQVGPDSFVRYSERNVIARFDLSVHNWRSFAFESKFRKAQPKNKGCLDQRWFKMAILFIKKAFLITGFWFSWKNTLKFLKILQKWPILSKILGNLYAIARFLYAISNKNLLIKLHYESGICVLYAKASNE